LDIIEIDAASNRRIDEIRDLRDKVHIAPSVAKYKVYIIDEVHMLTKEAFNALLKTLEEPPAHVVFILATTEVNKLPETIISRTQRFTFRPIEDAEIVKHLKHIAKQEKIKIDDQALAVIAQAGQGSFRDSISLLDQLSSYGPSDVAITAEDIRANLGVAPTELVGQLLSDCLSGKAKELMDGLQNAYQQGYEASHLAKQLAQLAQSQYIEAPTDQQKQLLALLKQLIEVPSSHDPATSLLLVLLDIGLSPNPQQDSVTVAASRVAEPPALVQTKTVKAIKDVKASNATKAAQATKVAAPTDATFEEAWQQTLDSIKKSHNTLYGVLRMAQAKPGESQDQAVLSFQFAFHQKRLNEPKNKQIVSDLLSHMLGRPVRLDCQLSAKPAAKTANKDAAGNHLATISNIFGSAEVLES
jgi:DNA polymerase-3 subunit gamma/tau